MRVDAYCKIVLTAIAVFLGLIALQPWMRPPAANAQEAAGFHPLLFDNSLRSISSPDGRVTTPGRLAIDLRTGNIYGFPTDAVGYPRNVSADKPAVADPILLGRFNLDRIPGRKAGW